MSASHSYRDRLVERLRALLQSRGTSVREVEKRIGHGRGYVSDALRGEKKLGIEVILEVLAAVRVRPEEFFEKPTTTPPARTAAAPRPAQRRVERAAVRKMLLQLVEKGLLDADQLEDLQRELSSRESA